MPTSTSGAYNSNPGGVLPFLFIEGVSTVTIHATVTPLPGEVISKIRFVVWDKNDVKTYSPEITFTGGYAEYNFGTMLADWVYTSQSGNKILYAGWGVITNIQQTPWAGAYGNFGSTTHYSKPQVNLFNVSRNTTTETQADFAIDIASSPVIYASTEYNFLKYKRQYFTTTWVDIDTLITAPGLDVTATLSYDLPFLTDKSYTARIVIEDLFNTVYVTDILPTALVPFSVGKTGVGAGKIHEQGVLDIQGESFKNGVLQPTIFRKKESDPDPDGMEDGDILIIYNETTPFTSTNFPQEFGTGYTWSQVGTWPTDYNYWTSTSATTNTIVESMEASSFKGSNYPYLIFDNDTYFSNGIMMPYGTLPGVQIIKFKGSVQFNSFQLTGWGQDHEPKNSPKSFAFFGSNDAHTWVSLYDTIAFEDTWKTTSTATVMSNSGLYFKYLKLVWRTNQDDNSGNLTNATMIAVRELSFDASGHRYV